MAVMKRSKQSHARSQARIQRRQKPKRPGTYRRVYGAIAERLLIARSDYIRSRLRKEELLLLKLIDSESIDYLQQEALCDGYRAELRFLEAELQLMDRLRKPTVVRLISQTTAATASVGILTVKVVVP